MTSSPLSALEPIYTIPPYRIEGPEMARSQLSEVVDWGAKEHGLPEVWERTKGKGIRVGVIDTGVGDHPDLPEPVFRYNSTRNTTDRDHQGHATHVAGILAARANGLGVVGIAPECEIGYVKGLSDQGFGRDIWLAEAVNICVREGCQIINMSWGGGYSARIESALQFAVAEGVICVAAAGNSGHGGTIHPGNSDWTAGVASYNREGKVSGWSSRGPAVDLACPGENITSTWLGGKYQSLSGTSMACPFLSGVLALALAAGVPIEARSVREQLRPSIVDKGEPGHDPNWGWGVLDVHKLIPEPDLSEEIVIGPYKVTWHPSEGLRILQADPDHTLETPGHVNTGSNA